MDILNLWLHCYRFTLASFHFHSIKLRGLPLSAVTVSLHYMPRYLSSTASSNMQQNAYYRNLKWTMVLLRNKDQQQKNPLPSSATQSRHKWTASSLLHDNSTMNLALVQCECRTGKETVIARTKSINQNWAADFMFSRKFWFLGSISRGGKCPFPPMRTPMYGRHGTCHGCHFDGGRKNRLSKSKICSYSFLNLYFAPHTFTNCKAASTQRPYLMHVLAPPTIMTKLWYCGITMVRHCDRIRTLACHIYEQ